MLKIEVLPHNFTVCKLKSVPEKMPSERFCFLSVTDSEISLVCPTDSVPENTYAREDLWRAFRISGTLDFSLIGILADISGILAKEKISIFALSTYDTDYVLVKTENLKKALKALSENGYEIKNTENLF